MRKVPEHIKIKVPVWGNRWIFLLKYTPENVAAAGGKYEKNDDDALAMVLPMGYGRYGLFYKDDAELPDIAHECLHLTHRIMGDLGHQFTDYTNDEAEAYLFRYIFGIVIEKIKQQGGNQCKMNTQNKQKKK